MKEKLHEENSITIFLLFFLDMLKPRRESLFLHDFSKQFIRQFQIG
jgi:hypothetical protein